MSAPTIIEAINDPALWAPHFRDRETWLPWFTAIKCVFGLELDEIEFDLFRQCTGRASPPDQPVREFWGIAGRRAGKSRCTALCAAYLAAFVDWSPYLVQGERGVIVVIASDRRQCRSIMSYLRAFLIETESLSELVAKDTDEEIVLRNGITVEVVTCNFRAVRGRTVIAALCDEAAFWASEDGSNPASEVIRALRPAMATIPRSVLIVVSSPYARRGPLYDAHERYYGKDGRILVWRAPTWVMNPSLPRDGEFITEEYEKDPANAVAEFGAEFRSDLESYVSKETVDAAIVQGRKELPPTHGLPYVGFCDAASGSSGGGDSFTAAIAHLDRVNFNVVRQVQLDAVLEIRPPFSPEGAIKRCAEFFRAYGVRRVTADRYAGSFPVEIFARHGVTVIASENSKSEIYSEFLPMLNSGRVELLDPKKSDTNQRLIQQLLGLERRTARGGKDQIDHGPSGRDDLINSAAGCCVLAATKPPMKINAEVLARSRLPGSAQRQPRAGLPVWATKPPSFFGRKDE